MPKNSTFVDNLMSLYRPMFDVTAKPMFGGTGFFKDGLMFAMVANDELYLKADDKLREAFEKRGLGKFTYEKKGEEVALSYYQAPVECVDDSAALVDWSKQAFEAARRVAKKGEMKTVSANIKAEPMDEKKLEELYRKAAKGNWTYPQLFDGLKNIGVERYEVKVPLHEITYVGGGKSIVHPAPEGFQTLTVGHAFDLAGIKKALGRVQSKETNYIQFLGEIAAAGVPYYRVDMKPRTVTYHGKNRTDKLVEKVPRS